MVIEKFTNGTVADARSVNNKQSLSGLHMIGPGDRVRQYIHIFSLTDVPQVRLYLYGKKAFGQAGTTAFSAQHDHSTHRHKLSYDDLAPIGNAGFLTETVNSALRAEGNYYSGAHEADCIENKQIGTAGATTAVATTVVPQAVTIWIDGVEKTAGIGDPNTKGATMYDPVNDDWGIDGTTEWDTGELDLSSEIVWSVGEHYIELRETGLTGGRIQWIVYIN